MADFNPKTTPEQQGVQYESASAPTFNTGDLVATAASWTVKEGAELDKTQDGGADVDNIGTTGHHLVGSGDFKIKKTALVPHKGDAIVEDDVTPARHWVVTSDVEISGFSSGGKAMMVKFDVEYHKKVSDAIIAAAQ